MARFMLVYTYQDDNLIDMAARCLQDRTDHTGAAQGFYDALFEAVLSQCASADQLVRRRAWILADSKRAVIERTYPARLAQLMQVGQLGVHPCCRCLQHCRLTDH